eukprot:1157332-Pelagomonas_calceolata.AAC.5
MQHACKPEPTLRTPGQRGSDSCGPTVSTPDQRSSDSTVQPVCNPGSTLRTPGQHNNESTLLLQYNLHATPGPFFAHPASPAAKAHCSYNTTCTQPRAHFLHTRPAQQRKHTAATLQTTRNLGPTPSTPGQRGSESSALVAESR